MKKANCFGTNYLNTGNDLSECVNDANDMTTLLNGQVFEVSKYLEKQDTKVKFKAELISLVDKAISGEITGAAQTQSGHGTNGHDANGVLHEGLYFTDSVFWDYEIAPILERIPEGFPFFLFWDVCFAGGLMKKAGAKIKFIHTDEVPLAIPVRGTIREIASNNAIYFSACSADEYSYDATDLNNGAATYWLKNTFKKDITFQDWFNKIREHLPSDEYPQTPLLICKDPLKLKKAFSWFDPVVTDIPDVVVDPPKPPLTSEAKKKLAVSYMVKIRKLVEKYNKLII
jgi:hypothetical protein